VCLSRSACAFGMYETAPTSSKERLSQRMRLPTTDSVSGSFANWENLGMKLEANYSRAVGRRYPGFKQSSDDAKFQRSLGAKSTYLW
jgi:hypothetical protein